MGLDPRSLERLRELGRRLPERLPPPEPSPQSAQAADATPPAPASAGGPPRRHRLETERDPAQLFRALMTASADGSVPPHLLERLRELEVPRQPAVDAAPQNRTLQQGAPSGDPSAAARRAGRRPNTSAKASGSANPESDLYTAFQQLLLEEGDA